jgi:hypothetical protein
MLEIDNSQSSVIKIGSTPWGKKAGPCASFMLAGGTCAMGSVSQSFRGTVVLGWVLLILWHGLFMCPFAVATFGLRYLKISFLVKFGHLLKKPVHTAFNNVEIFGLHNDWCANLTPFACMRTECVKDARSTPGCKAGQKCRAQSRKKAYCDRVVRILLHPFIGTVHRSVAASLYLRKVTLPLIITSHLSQLNKTVQPALHNCLIPINDATVRCGTMCQVKTVGNPGMVMSQTCVDIICRPLSMLIFEGFDAGGLSTTSMPSMMKMEVAPVSAITWVDAIVIAFRYSFVGLPHNACTAVANNEQGLNLIA